MREVVVQMREEVQVLALAIAIEEYLNHQCKVSKKSFSIIIAKKKETNDFISTFNYF